MFYDCRIGFGTGLNLLATWQLWRQLRDTYPQLADARLHFITTEKFPIPLADLTHILALWGQRAPELVALIEPLLAAYPPLIAGCHRLDFSYDNLTVDIWLGDAAQSLSKLAIERSQQSAPQPHIDAWFWMALRLLATVPCGLTVFLHRCSAYRVRIPPPPLIAVQVSSSAGSRNMALPSKR